MNVYKYSKETKEYISAEVAQLDPLETEIKGENVYLLPANATFTAPPAKKEGFAMVWNGEAWEEVEDHRGTEYWLPGDAYGTPAREMKELGPLPEGATTTAPEKTLDELKADKLAALKAERDNKEVEPIEYNGNSFDYDEKARDRINAAIIALEVAGDSASLEWTAADNADVTVTATDLKGIISAVAVRSNTLHVAYRAAKEKVAAAQSKKDLEAIELD